MIQVTADLVICAESDDVADRILQRIEKVTGSGESNVRVIETDREEI